MMLSHTPSSSRRRPFRALAALACASLLAAAGEARAQIPDRIPEAGNGAGVDLHLFRPAVDSKGFFSVNGADVLGKNDVSLGLVLDYGRALMPLSPGHGADWLAEHSFQGTFHFDYGIANLLVVGISAPVVLAGGDGATDIGPTGATYASNDLSAQALGNLALHVKLRILRPNGPIGLALIAQGGYGVGGSRNLVAEPGFWYWPQAVVEKQFGTESIVRTALNVGYRGHTGENSSFGLGADGTPQLSSGVFQYSNLFTGGFALSVRVLSPLDLVAETYASYQLGGNSDDKQRISAEAIGGIKLFIERNSYFMLAGGVGYLPGFQSAGQRATLGFVFEPSIGDRDNDGIPDNEDQCPDEREDRDDFEDTDGCPDPDNDQDGIPDKLDRCPNDPEDMDGDEDEDGCPEVNDKDSDGDGIIDAKDKCPNKPEDKNGFQDADGCPDDRDGDGIPDVKDKCPDVPEDKDGYKDDDGCPEDDDDRDGDGIPDARDKCPSEPEVFNGHEDEDGCPDKGKVVIEEHNIMILDKILFKTGSAEILPQSFPIVDAVATTLVHHPEFLLLEVQGHADERGNDNLNLKLTQARSEAVLDALAQRNVPRGKLRAVGYGEYCPVDPAHGAKAWEKNRRVEFKVVKTTSGPTGVELGCEAARKKGIESTKP